VGERGAENRPPCVFLLRDVGRGAFGRERGVWEGAGFRGKREGAKVGGRRRGGLGLGGKGERW
jgi:hypothetical protein